MKFKDLIGVDAQGAGAEGGAMQTLVGQLVASIREERLPHAQMFLGPEGNGGVPLALAFAQFLNCENPSEHDSCGVCPSCIKSQKFIHPDIHFAYPILTVLSGPKSQQRHKSLDWLPTWREALNENPYQGYVEWSNRMQGELGGSNKQGNMPAAECADILRKLHLKTFEGKYKVLILWLPEYLGKEGNRLLKLIEEPPPDTVFLFVAEDLDRILNTIISRTQILRVPRFQAEEIEGFLEATYELEDGMATQIAALAEGNSQQALRLLEADSLDQEDTAFIPWLDSVIRWQILSISGWQDTFAKLGREKQKNFFRLALHEVREAYLESLASGTGKNPDIRERAHYLNASGWGALAEDIGKAQGYIERNANPRIVMWNLAIRTSRRIQEYQIAKASSNS